jgi:predicted metal-dependent enzyme (double-stranded beta helix superfamily)
MVADTYTLCCFGEDLRSIVGQTQEPSQIIVRLRPLVQRLALAKDWLQPHHYACDPAQGFGINLLHEEPDHTLAVFAIGWLPGHGAPPHNHGTWAVVAGDGRRPSNRLSSKSSSGPPDDPDFSSPPGPILPHNPGKPGQITS